MKADHFLNCMRAGRRPITDGETGLRMVAALKAADMSLRECVSKTVERRRRPDRRLRVVVGRKAADRSPLERIDRTVERPMRLREPDGRIAEDADRGGEPGSYVGV